ncbi:MAG TPA: tryptophan--tRNA ligase [Sulfurimonas sp.]|nr:tryptophan--tRNA ligase [Sulfurimonas sp.]
MKVLAGIQPSGDLHIGNYFGSIKKMIDRQDKDNVYAFIANYHAMTSVKDGPTLSKYTMQAATDFLALGINPEKTMFWVQSDVKEVLELYWMLSQFTSMGLLERAHSYKDKVAKGKPANHSLFSYPVLMAADIILFDTEIVPVGKDQIQHVEMARDIAVKFNNEYGESFFLPEHQVEAEVATVPGIDGAKMSKSYGNTINIFGEEKKIQKVIKKIVTDTTPLDEPKDFESCNIYALAKLFLDKNGLEDFEERYRTPGEGYGHFKLYLHDVMWEYFKPYREKREYFENNQDEVRSILKMGAEKAALIAAEKMEIIRCKTGIAY